MEQFYQVSGKGANKAYDKVGMVPGNEEGAADRSSEFGLAAAYAGDVLKLTAQVQAEEGVNPDGISKTSKARRKVPSRSRSRAERPPRRSRLR